MCSRTILPPLIFFYGKWTYNLFFYLAFLLFIKHTQNLPRLLVTVKIIPYLFWWLGPSQYSTIARDICKEGHSSIFISGA